MCTQYDIIPNYYWIILYTFNIYVTVGIWVFITYIFVEHNTDRINIEFRAGSSGFRSHSDDLRVSSSMSGFKAGSIGIIL